MSEHLDIENLVEEATLDFTLGDDAGALEKLNRALAMDREYFPAWHALTEVYFSRRDLDKALEAAEAAHRLNPGDIHINTSLSRIWVERGDKDMAEKYNAEARRLSWKEDLKMGPGEDDSL